MTNNHSDFYGKAKYYDVAFSFKNVKEENQTILNLFQKYCGRKAKSFLDIAAGPASNAMEMASRGISSRAIDYSQDMVSYGLMKAKQKGVDINYVRGDMRSFDIEEPVDLAAIFMDSTSYLLTNDDFVNHLKSVAKSLVKDGIYILEMSHPRDVFSVGKSSITEWTESRDDISVSVKWGNKDDLFDPIKETAMVTAQLRYKTSTQQGLITDCSEQRIYTFQTLDALVKAAGCFEIIDVIGSFKPGISFSNDKECWRMIPILKVKKLE